LRLLKFAPHASVDDQFDARANRGVETGRKVERLFLAPIERGIRLPRRFKREWNGARQVEESRRQTLKLAIPSHSKICA
jgi:hypothetical protein